MQKDLSAVVRTRSLKQKREREEERETKRDLSRETSGVAGAMRAWRTNTPNAGSSSSSAHERRAEHGTWGSLARSHSHLTRGYL